MLEGESFLVFMKLERGDRENSPNWAEWDWAELDRMGLGRIGQNGLGPMDVEAGLHKADDRGFPSKKLRLSCISSK
jgi:hypothetical protein